MELRYLLITHERARLLEEMQSMVLGRQGGEDLFSCGCRDPGRVMDAVWRTVDGLRQTFAPSAARVAPAADGAGASTARVARSRSGAPRAAVAVRDGP